MPVSFHYIPVSHLLLTFAVGWNAIPHGYRQACSHPGTHQLEARVTGEGALCVDGRPLLGTLHDTIGWGMELLARLHYCGENVNSIRKINILIREQSGNKHEEYYIINLKNK